MNKAKGIFLGIVIMITAFFTVGCTISAYDIAVKNGFEGTEEQWLYSINGVDGADGADLMIQDVYDKAVENGFEGSYMDFLHEFLSFTQAEDNSEAINKGLRSAVLVHCAFTKRQSVFESAEFTQSGAGVIYKINKSQNTAYIITNYHVVFSLESNTENKVSSKITVMPYGGSQIAASYVGGSANYDIAVLRIQDEYVSTDFPTAVTLGSDVTVGQTAIAIGNPAGRGISATEGIISVESENITMTAIDNESGTVNIRVMRIDAAVNSGNSGGGLFDGSGNLIGIVNAKASDTSIENMAYAIPVSIATAVADNIMDNGMFNKGTVGISISAKNSKGYIDEDGNVRIAETVVISSTTGAAKDKLFAGDQVLSIIFDGVEYTVTRLFHLTDPLLRSKPGDEITLKVLRKGEEITVVIICE